MCLNKFKRGIKMNKKISLALSSLALSGMMLLPVGAQTYDTEFTFEYKNEPSYMFSIPSKLDIDFDGSEMKLEVSDVKNLDSNEKIVMNVSGTDAYNDQMIVQHTESNSTIQYQIIREDGVIIKTVGRNYVNGKKLAEFSESGEQTLTVKVDKDNVLPTDKLGTYKSNMTFEVGIEEK